MIPLRLRFVLAATLVSACADSASTTGTHRRTDLAPSQVDASTVPRPQTPPPCDPDVVTIGPRPGTSSGDVVVVLAIENTGGARCEVDVFGSPNIDPLIEPDVWLEPGATAELVVSDAAPGCASPAMVASIQIDVNGAERIVDLPPSEVCAVLLTALYPL